MESPNLADDETLIRPRLRAPGQPPNDPSEVITDKTRLPGYVQSTGRDPFEHDPVSDLDGGSTETSEPPQEQPWAPESPWRLNHLGALLLIALGVAVVAVVGLRVQLSRARADAAEALENLAQLDERLLEVSKVARAQGASGRGADKPTDPAEAAPGAVHRASQGATQGATEEASQGASGSAQPEPPPPTAQSSGRLHVLLTVGTRPFAERQLRILRRRCGPSLALYRQKRGRCAFSACWVIAAPADEPARTAACGPAKGKALRDRSDFVAPS